LLTVALTAYHGRAFNATKGCDTPPVWQAVLTAHQDECEHDPNQPDDQAWDTLASDGERSKGSYELNE